MPGHELAALAAAKNEDFILLRLGHGFLRV
jgi:hypothetical protein